MEQQYLAGNELDEEAIIRQAVELMLSVMTPNEIMALADHCCKVAVKGFGQVRATWHNGRPELLYMVSDPWRDTLPKQRRRK
jgi:hypothetical protein